MNFGCLKCHRFDHFEYECPQNAGGLIYLEPRNEVDGHGHGGGQNDILPMYRGL